MPFTEFYTTTGKLLILSLLLLQSPLTLNSLEISVTVGVGISIGDAGTPPSPSDCSDCPPTAQEPCPPPTPPPEPQPSDFPNLKQYNAYLVIQRFKATITCDPQNVTGTWVGYRPCENYRGFFCEAPPNSLLTPTIASVDFNGFRLCAPTLSGFVDRLPDLALFHANSNNFSGTVPDLTNLPFLYELDVSNNKLSGQFPTTVLPNNRLIFLDLRFNQFSSSLPPPVFLLDLDFLFLNNNQFNQPIPYSIGNTPAAYLTLANNGFTGPIPASISNISGTLIEILLLNNCLSGCIPYQIGLLHEATVFDAGFNKLTGEIPLSFGCLAKVEQLNLAENLLYGDIPDVVCRLAKTGRLMNLSLSGNYFTSVGASCWGLIKTGVLDVRRNCILGLKDQRPAGECIWFLLKPKFCPCRRLIPCSLPKWPRNGMTSSPVPVRQYKGYAALRGNGGL